MIDVFQSCHEKQVSNSLIITSCGWYDRTHDRALRIRTMWYQGKDSYVLTEVHSIHLFQAPGGSFSLRFDHKKDYNKTIKHSEINPQKMGKSIALLCHNQVLVRTQTYINEAIAHYYGKRSS